ncbi:predicted protein [Sclerotinia sclerotiorum 1980 UF-70]|uniref:Uncharacterized protein n=1 Tax=Sclerotinia sclerotiorum (strain ATCC 18683 / 1980 / Ss-1) TaxID=665079 RepID=A7F8H0_SCLS1|nr:predicted protein [Sclerotinia sclerotiorum 1980 UF-70]EDN99041.1 predicted protein [Sclerotinia sclerotiorum 1980 UF-70]
MVKEFIVLLPLVDLQLWPGCVVCVESLSDFQIIFKKATPENIRG